MLARAGEPEGMRYLGLLHLRGLGVEEDPVTAFQWTEAAVRAGASGAARFTLAGLYYLGLGTARNPTCAQTHLLDAARSGNPAALRTLGLVYLAFGPSWNRKARACLACAAQAQDLFALHAIAVLHLLEGDPARALPLLSKAGTRGLMPSLLRLKALQRELGIPKVRELAIRAPQLPKRPWRLPIRHFDWDTAVPGVVTTLEPRIGLTQRAGLLHPVECDYLMALAAPHLRAPGTTGPESTSPAPSHTRMQFTRHSEDLLLCRLEERIAAFAQGVWNERTALTIERQLPENGGGDPAPRVHPREAQPRARETETSEVVIVIQLHDAFTGGEMCFPVIRQSVPPGAGNAIAFCPMDPAGQPNPLATCEETQVTSGEKWMALAHLNTSGHPARATRDVADDTRSSEP